MSGITEKSTFISKAKSVPLESLNVLDIKPSDTVNLMDLLKKSKPDYSKYFATDLGTKMPGTTTKPPAKSEFSGSSLKDSTASTDGLPKMLSLKKPAPKPFTPSSDPGGTNEPVMVDGKPMILIRRPWVQPKMTEGKGGKRLDKDENIPFLLVPQEMPPEEVVESYILPDLYQRIEAIQERRRNSPFASTRYNLAERRDLFRLQHSYYMLRAFAQNPEFRAQLGNNIENLYEFIQEDMDLLNDMRKHEPEYFDMRPQLVPAMFKGYKAGASGDFIKDLTRELSELNGIDVSWDIREERLVPPAKDFRGRNIALAIPKLEAHTKAHGSMEGLVFSEADFSEVDLSTLNVRGADFSKAWGVVFRGTIDAESLSGVNLRYSPGYTPLGWKPGEKYVGPPIGAQFRDAKIVGDLRRMTLTGAHLHDVNLDEANLQGADFTGSRGVRFKGTLDPKRFEGSTLTDTHFDEAVIDGDFTPGTRLNGVFWSKTNLTKTNMQGRNLEGSVFEGSNASGVSFENAWLDEVVTDSANFSGARFQGASFQKAVMANTNLSGAVFNERTNFQDAQFVHCNLTNIQAKGVTMRGVILHGSVLHGAHMEGASLEEANLSNVQLDGRTNLHKANLTGAMLHGLRVTDSADNRTNLAKATLTGASLLDAQLGHADLSDANLEGANLQGANLSQAVLTGAKLDGAVYDDRTQFPGINNTDPAARAEFARRHNMVHINQLEMMHQAESTSAISGLMTEMYNRVRDQFDTVRYSKAMEKTGRTYTVEHRTPHAMSIQVDNISKEVEQLSRISQEGYTPDSRTRFNTQFHKLYGFNPGEPSEGFRNLVGHLNNLPINSQGEIRQEDLLAVFDNDDAINAFPEGSVMRETLSTIRQALQEGRDSASRRSMIAGLAAFVAVGIVAVATGGTGIALAGPVVSALASTASRAVNGRGDGTEFSGSELLRSFAVETVAGYVTLPLGAAGRSIGSLASRGGGYVLGRVGGRTIATFAANPTAQMAGRFLASTAGHAYNGSAFAFTHTTLDGLSRGESLSSSLSRGLHSMPEGAVAGILIGTPMQAGHRGLSRLLRRGSEPTPELSPAGEKPTAKLATETTPIMERFTLPKRSSAKYMEKFTGKDLTERLGVKEKMTPKAAEKMMDPSPENPVVTEKTLFKSKAKGTVPTERPIELHRSRTGSDSTITIELRDARGNTRPEVINSVAEAIGVSPENINIRVVRPHEAPHTTINARGQVEVVLPREGVGRVRLVELAHEMHHAQLVRQAQIGGPGSPAARRLESYQQVDNAYQRTWERAQHERNTTGRISEATQRDLDAARFAYENHPVELSARAAEYQALASVGRQGQPALNHADRLVAKANAMEQVMAADTPQAFEAALRQARDAGYSGPEITRIRSLRPDLTSTPTGGPRIPQNATGPEVATQLRGTLVEPRTYGGERLTNTFVVREGNNYHIIQPGTNPCTGQPHPVHTINASLVTASTPLQSHVNAYLGRIRPTSAQARTYLERRGYTLEATGETSHGQPIYRVLQNGRNTGRRISFDVGSGNNAGSHEGAIWKDVTRGTRSDQRVPVDHNLDPIEGYSL